MANKFRSISELSEQTAKLVTKNVNGWKSYLDTAARLYKYPFDEQLLIYAQRPDATACAEMETWNDKMHRWVKPGSKGIALIRKTNGGKAHLEYIFDVADTRPVKGAKTPYLWRAKEQNYDAILKTMEAQYGKTDGQDFGENLMEYAAQAVQMNYQEFLHDLHGNIAGSLLDGLDDLNLNVQFRNVLTSTVQYTLLTRCGLNPSQYLEDEDLQGIVAFSTPATLTHLGVAANSISGDLLSEIGKTIRLFDKENLQIHQQNLRKTLENSEDIGYTKDTKEFNGLNRESEEKNAGIDLYEERGLLDSGFSDGRAGGNRGNAAGQVRETAGDIPERTSTGNIHLNVDDRQIGETLEGDRPDRTGTSRRDGSRNDEETGDRREVESTRPVSMGGRDEQPDSASGRNSDERSHIHINENEQETAGEKPAVFASVEPKPELFQLTLFPTVEEQLENIAQAQDVEHGIQEYPSTSVFSDKSATKVPDAVIARALTSGGNNPHSIERIVAFFQKSPSGSASASFMKQEYGTGGKGLSIGGKEYAMWFEQEGIRIAEGRTTDIPSCTLVPWVKAGAQVYQLLKEGAFATQDKIDAAPENEYRELAEGLWYLRQDLSDEAGKQGFLPKLTELYGNFPESTEKIKELLKTLEGRAVFVKEVSDFMVAYDNDRELLRFQFQHTPKALISRLEKLNLVPEQFKAVDNFVPAMGKFITQDEIDDMLTRSSGVSEMKMGIYSYFMQGHNAKERVAFLQKEYGTGGITYTGYDEWHDSKGIKLSRADDFSGRENYDTVRLTWTQVEKRIEELINEGSYLTLDEEAYLPDYEKRVLAQELKSFFDLDPNAPTEKRNRDDLLPYLPEPSEINELQEEMVKILAAVSPDYPHLNTMQKALEDINAYADGTYSLFNPLPEKALQAEPRGKQAVKNPKQRRFKTREKSDGQITIDFGAMRVAEHQPLNEPEPSAPDSALQEKEKPATEPLTDLQKKAAEIAGRYEKLPLQEKIGVIAQAFGCTKGKIETSPCTGKWRGTSDISIRFDNGVSLFIGNALTPKAKTAKVQNECVNRALVQYNPEIISITKEAAAAVLMKREAKDNEIAVQKGLKPYTLLNVEFNDGADEKSAGYIGWYYVTLSIDGKICAHMETGLKHDIADGKVSETPTRANYFTAGALEETDVDYIFNNEGFSSVSSLYSLPIRDDVRERAEKTLAARGATAPSTQEQANSAPTIGGLNPKSPADLYHEFLPKIQQYFEASPEYIHYRKLDRNTGIEEIKKQIDLLVSEMENLDGDFREACSKYPLFSDWMATDIYTRITRHFPETRENDPDLVTLHAFDADVPDWVNTGTKEPPETSFVELYRNALVFLVNEIRSSNLYSYLQDKNTTYDEALDEIDSEIAFHMGNLAETNPALYHAYTSLPMFRDWLIEDALALNYHEPIKDNRDAIDRYANEPNMPQWLQKTGISLNIEKSILNVPEEKYDSPLENSQDSILRYKEYSRKYSGAIQEESRELQEYSEIPSEKTFQDTDLKDDAKWDFLDRPRITKPKNPTEQTYAEIYREALGKLIDMVRFNSLYSYLRDDNLADKQVREALDVDIQIHMNSIKENQPVLYQAYTSLPNFREWLIDDLLKFTYSVDYISDYRDSIEIYFNEPDSPEWVHNNEPVPIFREEQTQPEKQESTRTPEEPTPLEKAEAPEPVQDKEPKPEPKKRPGRTYPEQNYRILKRLFPDFVNGAYTSLRLQAGTAMMPLCVERIGEDEISIAHYFRQSGDSIADPDMTFRIDHEKQTLEPLTFEQPGIYQRVYPEPGKWIPRLRADLNRFTNQWFHNIEQQEYLPERAVMEMDGNRTEVVFVDGKAAIPENETAEENIPPEENSLPETTGAGDSEIQEQPDTQQEPDLTPHVDEYLNLKTQYPDKVIGVQVGGHSLYYGKDAEAAAPALGTKLLTREIPGLGETLVTGSTAAWKAQLKKLLEHGHSVVIAQPDPEQPEGPYEVVKERDIADFIPLGMQLTIDGRHMEVDSIDYENGRVSLKDLDIQGWFPIFREESVSFVREFVEKEQKKAFESVVNQEELQNAAKQGQQNIEPAQPEPAKVSEPADLAAAKELINDFLLNEYDEESDFSDLEHVGLAYTTTEDEQHEIQVEVNLLDFSISQLVDGECVEKRSYDSLRELIDTELSSLDFDELVRLETSPEERQAEPPVDLVELEGGTVGGAVSDTPPEEVKLRSIVIDLTAQSNEPKVERHNYHITDDNLSVGGQKTKYQNNVAAIRTLKQIEAEGRLALPEEQETLSKYVGWGGLAEAFDSDNDKWVKEYTELKELLTPEEYQSAQSTVLNAHYTSPTVIKAIYEGVNRMGFTPGNILEPSCGIGNFFGLLPEKLSDSKLYGVELDSVTGRIAKQLYQQAEITIDGFEKTDHPDNFFDLAVGNVPFGNYGVYDKRYNKENFLIHDYFITKALDKVRPGGIVAFITTKGTMDKADTKARESIAQKADLLGAIRLPNNAFQANARTNVTTDILFLQKCGSVPEKMPDWVHVGQTEDGVPLNNYFLQYPEMVLGKMEHWKNMYGNEAETACIPIDGADLSAQLSEAVTHITPPNQELIRSAPIQEDEENISYVPAAPDVRNFSYTLSNGQLYFRENSHMRLEKLGEQQANRIKGMIKIRDSARQLIDLQLDNAGDTEIKAEQAKLNTLYDRFTKEFGLINDKANRLAFEEDSSYPLLCSLEVLDEDKKLERKADIFTKRTIQHNTPVTSVDTSVEALGVSIGERACVDLGFMASLMGGSEKIPQIVNDLKGVIFKDPSTGCFDFEEGGTNWSKGWLTEDAYLSGNVRQKLEEARAAAESNPEFAVNVAALEQVQPKDLSASEISVRIGAPWVDVKYYKQFMYELLQTPEYLQNKDIDLLYSEVTCEWYVKGKKRDSETNSCVWNTYGTKRINAYEIFEASLNQHQVQIYDNTKSDEKGDRVLNVKDTTVAQQRQEILEEAFRNWIFKDPERRADLCNKYNRIFNSIRLREYNGEHIQLSGMNSEIKLLPHQRNAVARILYGKNSLLAHCVGAGKTYTMTAAAMESKRLGLCQKSMFVVPNHLTEQWGSDFLKLYPGSKVLVATKKDFQKNNRKKFCARIATGDYDAVIIGHSQFGKIPISVERQEAIIRNQVDDIVEAIKEAKESAGDNFSIKRMERTRKNLELKIKKLYEKEQDDTVTFEELGIDRLFVDEAQEFKNLYMHTKMLNVSGITQSDAQKSNDLFAKCCYMDEITNGRGVTFATGTPISNSMVELYTMMRYLQNDTLESHNLKHFDNWATTFGEKVTALELKPEGTGFRAKTRFSRFYNLPELMNLWRESADIQTAEMLNLPVPKAEYITISTEASDAQKQIILELADRAEIIRRRAIDPKEDNLLKITSEGRKLALDQRLINPLLPDEPGSKVNACVDNVFNIWQDSTPAKGTQLIFCDMSTPKGKSGKTKTEKIDSDDKDNQEEISLSMNVYADIKRKLISKGIPEKEIAFIHDADNEVQKEELFSKVRKGQIRVLLGSTQKMGAGTNVRATRF